MGTYPQIWVSTAGQASLPGGLYPFAVSLIILLCTTSPLPMTGDQAASGSESETGCVLSKALERGVRCGRQRDEFSFIFCLLACVFICLVVCVYVCFCFGLFGCLFGGGLFFYYSCLLVFVCLGDVVLFACLLVCSYRSQHFVCLIFLNGNSHSHGKFRFA